MVVCLHEALKKMLTKQLWAVVDYAIGSVGGRTFLEELCRSAGKTAGAGAAKLADQICHQK
jgi:hypothetical protein